jgi:hypothetical protein
MRSVGRNGVLNLQEESKREGSSSFLKKRTQKPLLAAPRPTDAPDYPGCGPRGQKFFGSFFQKRTASLLAFA